jgi:hypothetical protein
MLHHWAHRQNDLNGHQGKSWGILCQSKRVDSLFICQLKPGPKIWYQSSGWISEWKTVLQFDSGTSWHAHKLRLWKKAQNRETNESQQLVKEVHKQKGQRIAYAITSIIAQKIVASCWIHQPLVLTAAINKHNLNDPTDKSPNNNCATLSTTITKTLRNKKRLNSPNLLQTTTRFNLNQYTINILRASTESRSKWSITSAYAIKLESKASRTTPPGPNKLSYPKVNHRTATEKPKLTTSEGRRMLSAHMNLK